MPQRRGLIDPVEAAGSARLIVPKNAAAGGYPQPVQMVDETALRGLAGKSFRRAEQSDFFGCWIDAGDASRL